jgi:hypothetical protein
MEDFFKHVLEHVTATVLLNYILVPIVMTTALGAILRGTFNRLNAKKEIFVFSSASFVLFLSLIYAVGSRPQTPELTGTIQAVVGGNGASDRETIVVFTVGVINTGTMQTIVKNWHVAARSNGRDYEAVFPVMPENFTFANIPSISPNQPVSITYHKADSILEKSLTPIQVGSIATGLVFAVFQNVDGSVFKTGVDYKITYEDVFSRSYSMAISTSGTMSVVGIAPGIQAEMVCPTPPGGLPKLGNDITSSVNPPASAVPTTKPAISP